MKHLLIFAFPALFFLSIGASGQSLSGKVQSGSSGSKLGFANVNLYKKGVKVANLLTDEDGNFSLKLDTGTYTCEILYANHKKEIREIRVLSDENADFDLKADPTKTIRFSEEKTAERAAMPSYSNSEGSREAVVVSGITPGRRAKRAALKSRNRQIARYSVPKEETKILPVSSASKEAEVSEPRLSGKVRNRNRFQPSWSVPDTIRSGKASILTAGEVNDFSKWKFWSDLPDGALREYREIWQMEPRGRFSLQVKDKQNLPVPDVEARLLQNGKVLWTARTDNTGKAELWANLSEKDKNLSSGYSIQTRFQEGVRMLEQARPFGQGENVLVLDADCRRPSAVDIALVVDATGSMSDEIEFLKMDLNSVIFQSKAISNQLDMQFGNVFYRDIGDAYVTRTQPFNPVLSESVEFIKQQAAGGGGDGPEAVEIALDSAINHLQWRTEARARILFLVLDAPPHQTPEIIQKMQNLARQAAEKGIRIVPLAGSGINKSTEYLMRCLALATNGTYTFLTDHSGVGESHIQPTTDNFEVELLNNLLVRIIKSYVYLPECDQQVREIEVNLPDSLVAIPPPADSLAKNLPDSLTREKIPNTDNGWEFRYFPNPTPGPLHIVCTQAVSELFVTDLSGKILKRLENLKANQDYEIDLSPFATGFYLIRYPVGDNWMSGKVWLRGRG